MIFVDMFYVDHYTCMIIFSQIDHFVQKLYMLHFLFCKKICSLQINHPYVVLPKTMDFCQYGGHLLLFKSLKVNNNKHKKGLNDINTCKNWLYLFCSRFVIYWFICIKIAVRMILDSKVVHVISKSPLMMMIVFDLMHHRIHPFPSIEK